MKNQIECVCVCDRGGFLSEREVEVLGRNSSNNSQTPQSSSGVRAVGASTDPQFSCDVSARQGSDVVQHHLRIIIYEKNVDIQVQKAHTCSRYVLPEPFRALLYSRLILAPFAIPRCRAPSEIPMTCSSYGRRLGHIAHDVRQGINANIQGGDDSPLGPA